MRSQTKSLLALGGVLLASTLLAASAWAQDYPSRSINMVIPFPPGGNTDLMARALQPELAKALGQSVVVVNKGGAGGTIGDIGRSLPPVGDEWSPTAGFATHREIRVPPIAGSPTPRPSVSLGSP